LSLSDRLRKALAQRLVTPQLLTELEGEFQKTRGAISRYLLMPGPVLREPEWNFELLKDLCDRSFVMEMITRTLTQEVARPGLTIKAQFAVKCKQCQNEYATKVAECPQCKGTEFREPSPEERKTLEAILDNPNHEYDWNQILRAIVEHDIKLGNWWLSLTYETIIDPATKEPKRKLTELYVEDPRYMRILADAKGRITSDEYFCPTCYVKDAHQKLQREQIESGEVPLCEICHRPLVMTGYVQHVSGEATARWGIEEIVHGSSTRNLPELYGRPRPLSVWKWLMVLNAMLDYNTEIYSTGYVGGFLVFQGMEQDQVNSIKAQLEKEIETKQVIDAVTGRAAPSLRIRQAWVGTGAVGEKPIEADFIESMPNPAKMQSLEWFRIGIEKITSIFGVTPVFVSIIESGKAGNNPRMQIDVQNRTIQEFQQSIISTLNHRLLPRLEITDWELAFEMIELRDELREAQISEARGRSAERWLNAGFDVKIDPNTQDLIVSGQGRKPIEAPREGPVPQISEASGAILERDKKPEDLSQSAATESHPVNIALYLVHPHGKLIWQGEKTLIVKTVKFQENINVPVLLVSPDDGGSAKIWAIIKLETPQPISWKEFEALRERHRISDEEVHDWNWEGKDFYAYDFIVLHRLDRPIDIEVPRGVQTWFRLEKAQSILPGAPEHTHGEQPRGPVKEERGLARRLHSIALQYHRGAITKGNALKAGHSAIKAHRKRIEAIARRQLSRMTNRDVRELSPEASKRIEKITAETLKDFKSILEDFKG